MAGRARTVVKRTGHYSSPCRAAHCVSGPDAVGLRESCLGKNRFKPTLAGAIWGSSTVAESVPDTQEVRRHLVDQRILWGHERPGPIGLQGSTIGEMHN